MEPRLQYLRRKFVVAVFQHSQPGQQARLRTCTQQCALTYTRTQTDTRAHSSTCSRTACIGQHTHRSTVQHAQHRTKPHRTAPHMLSPYLHNQPGVMCMMCWLRPSPFLLSVRHMPLCACPCIYFPCAAGQCSLICQLSDSQCRYLGYSFGPIKQMVTCDAKHQAGCFALSAECGL